MQTIAMTNTATGEVTALTINASISVGDPFRLIGRDVVFRAIQTYTHAVADAMVAGVSVCGKFKTAARVCDTAVA